jgi:hypothetical protein
MRLDIRFPIGLLFSLLGLLLAGFGIVGNKGIYGRSLGLNVNLGWGFVLLVFGIVMVIFGSRGDAAQPRAQSSSDVPRHSKDDGHGA